MPSESPVFISYSRKDYYFAESLAFHLLRQGIPAWMDVKDLKPGSDWERGLESALAAASTLLLVVSTRSMGSERVHAEWQYALRRGCRVVIARIGNATIPPELQACEAVDFRGSFRSALRRLLPRLVAGADRSIPFAVVGAARWPRLPPWIAAMTLALAIPTLAYFAAADWAIGPDTQYRSLIVLAAPFAALGLAWFFCVAFLRRRMGMTRLGLCLMCLAIVFALPALGYFVRSLSFLARDDVAATFSAHWRLGLFLLTVPLVGLCILLLVRPEDLLRWTPTGKAWANYRIGHVANAAFGRAELSFQFEQIKTFVLEHDPADAPMAQRLREELLALGGNESSAPDDGTVPVLLLTNRTRLAWIGAQTQRLQKEGVTVVGTGIGLPPILDWLWRRQWIDFRRWDIGRSDPALALPQVPDAVTETRLPVSIGRAHHVLCAVAALVFILAGAVSPDEHRQSAGPSSNELLTFVTFATSVWWMLIAHRFVKRTRTAALLVRDSRFGWTAIALVVGMDFYVLANGKLTIGRILIIAVFLVAAWVWLGRQRASLTFWMPQDNSVRAAKQSTLGKHRDWTTLVWLLVYMMLWTWVLGFST